MPQADTVLLPICVAIALIGVILAGLAWRRGRKGRVLQAAALAIIPFGLYLTGFLRVVWDAAVDVVRWAVRLVFSPMLWIGFGLIGLCIVLLVVGGLINRFSPDPKPRAKSVSSGGRTAVAGESTGGQLTGPAKQPGSGKQRGKQSGKQAADVDPELAEIEALLKSRGIE